jgi:hypothetical protein
MHLRSLLPIFVIGALVTGCASAPAPTAPASATAPSSASALRTMTVYRSPDCSCCHLWADIARRDGWAVATVDVVDMTAFKELRGIPATAASCHTAVIGDYVVEGHVPMAAVERLLAELPAIDGIALPGMPAGSPGMGGVREAPFEVIALDDGEVTAFGSY